MDTVIPPVIPDTVTHLKPEFRESAADRIVLDSDWDAYEAARQKMIPNLSRGSSAVRYHDFAGVPA